MFNRKSKDADSELHSWKDPMLEAPRSNWWMLPVLALALVLGFGVAKYDVVSEWMAQRIAPTVAPVVKNEHITAQPKFGELPPSMAASRKDSRAFEGSLASTDLPDVPLVPAVGINHWAIVELPTGEARVAITGTPIYLRMKAMAEACIGSPNWAAAKIGFRGRDERPIAHSSALPDRELCFRTLDEPYLEIVLDEATLAVQIGVERAAPYAAARKLDATTLELKAPPKLAAR